MPEATLYEINNLLMQVGEGSEQAFRTVFNLYKKRFYVASLKMTHSRDMAEEIVQEVFVTLWIKRTQVAAASNPEAYLFTVLQHSIYAQFRKMALEKALKRNIEKQTPAEVGSEAEDILYDKQNRAMFETAISRLPPRQRLVYRMSRQQGFTREQIAGRLHISPNTVKNHLQQAILFIRAYFKAGASASLWVILLQSFKIIFNLFGSH